MIEVRFGARALADIDRIFDFLAQTEPAVGTRTAEQIIDAVRILGRHPLIGRPVRGMLRELVISVGRGGYAALYRYRADAGLIDVLAIRHQREAGYA